MGLMRYYCKTRSDTFDPTIKVRLCPGQYFHKEKNVIEVEKSYSHYLGFNRVFIEDLEKTTALFVNRSGKVLCRNQAVLDQQSLERKSTGSVALNFSAVTKVIKIREVGLFY